jgi:hypothetical protein
MIRFGIIALTTGLLMSVATENSWAQWVNGEEIYNLCQTKDLSSVTGYAAGVLDTTSLVTTHSICISKGVVLFQVVDVACTFLERQSPTQPIKFTVLSYMTKLKNCPLTKSITNFY